MAHCSGSAPPMLIQSIPPHFRTRSTLTSKAVVPMTRRQHSSKKTTTLYVRNMVCNRCIRVVREELERLGVSVHSIVLGEVVVAGGIPSLPIPEIRRMLVDNGFELIEDRRTRIIEQIKHEIIGIVFQSSGKDLKDRKISAYLSSRIGIEYHTLSSLFSSVENMTIEHYFLLQRVERVKELMKYHEQTLSEIAWITGFSSVQHLSTQFKQLTGMTPSEFRDLTHSLRKSIDSVGRK